MAASPTTILDRPREYSWLDHIDRHAHENPEGIALASIDVEVTWAQLRDRARLLALDLHERGVCPGNRVAIFRRNGPGFVVAMLAAHLLGAIAVPLNFRLTKRELGPVLERCTPAALLFAEEYRQLAEGLADSVGIPIRSGAADPGAAEQYAGVLTLTGTVPDPGPSTVERLVAQSPDSECALIMFTSGSTGRPKGAMLSYANLMSQVQTAIHHFKVEGESQVLLLNSPLFHIAGLVNQLRTLVMGRTLAYVSGTSFSPEGFLADLERFDVEETYLISSLWARVCKHMEARGITHPLKNLSWGAEPAGVSTLEAMARCFPEARIVSTFGQTEMSPVTTVLEPEYALSKIGSVGFACMSTSVRVVDESMDDVPTGEVGEAVYRGPGVMMGYWDDPEATAEAMAGGWFHSGDLVRRDEDGFFFIVDRMKNIIISGGENIFSPEVEEAILLHPNVGEVAVIGAPDEKWGEVPVAAVSLVDASVQTTEAEIIEHCRAVLASYKKPQRVHILPELPKNGTGKISKPDLRTEFG